MPYPITLAFVGVLVLVARSTADSGDTRSSAVPTTKSAIAAPDVPESAPTPTDPMILESPVLAAPADTADATMAVSTSRGVANDDLARFLAATETVLKGSPDEGIVYDAPAVYIGIAQFACARFIAGETFDQVANDLLSELSTENPVEDNRLVGALLGAAVQTICPDQAGVI